MNRERRRPVKSSDFVVLVEFVVFVDVVMLCYGDMLCLECTVVH